jgi:hypothetical protein
MRKRATAYTIAFLLASLLAVLPSAMWADFAIPMEANWENWLWKGQPHPRPQFSLQNPPTLFRLEMGAYRALVTPPAYLRRAITGFPTHYASLWVPPYLESAGIPPLAMALEHLAWALPLWFVLLVIVYEIGRSFRVGSGRRVAAA